MFETMLEHGSEHMREVLERGKRIEDYLDDTPLPSYLMLGTVAGRVQHVVAADDPDADETIMITTYEPDPAEWEADFKTRRRR